MRKISTGLSELVIGVLLLLAQKSAHADVVIDFNTLPSTYMFLGGGQNIGSYYPGVTFGPNVTGLDLTGSTAYPPYSGSIAAWDPYDLVVTISFDDPQTMVGFWYTSFDLLTLTAYDSTDTVLSSVVAPANTDGTTGTSDFVFLTFPNISSITLQGPPGGYVFEDVTFSQTLSSVPEPGSLTLLVPVCFLLFALSRRKNSNVRLEVLRSGRTVRLRSS